jgi:hypothetical protein
MTDRELLEAAAKAAGLRHVCYDGLDYDGRLGLQLVDGIGRHTETWNPLADDGDALRLAVKLLLEVSWWRSAVLVETDDRSASSGIVSFLEDANAATRRAIVLAAAAIGGAQ